MTTAVSKKVMEGALLTDLFYVKRREEKDHPPLDNEVEDIKKVDPNTVTADKTMQALSMAAGFKPTENRLVTRKEQQNFTKLKK